MRHKQKQIACWILTTAVMLVASAQIATTLSADDAIPIMKQERPEKIKRPAIIEFHGPIDWQLTKYFLSRLKRAEAAGVDLLIIDVDSPGGLKSESLEIAERLRDIDWAYTIAYVSREAISGGALVTLGCDELIVNQNARLGDIGIIQYDPQVFAFRFAPAKLHSVLARQARDLATAKGRPPELAEAMIDKDVLVYTRPKRGGLEFMTTRVDAEEPAAPWKLVEESGPERFLTLNGARAKELGFAQSFASNRAELAKGFDLSQKEIRVYEKNSTDSIVYYLNHPVGTGLLVVIGLVALYIELSAPGVGAGGLVAGLCAILFFWSRFLGGTSTWLEIILFLAGVVFLTMELFVIPGWGVSGLLGLLFIVGSLIMASQDFIVPQTSRQWNQFLTSALMLVCSGFVVFIAAAYITKKMGHLPVFNKMILAPPPSESEHVATKSKSTKPVPMPHPEISVGDWGKTESLLRPAGRAVFAHRSFDVVSDGAYIEPDRQVKVVTIQGNRIVVSSIEDDDLTDTVHRPGTG